MMEDSDNGGELQSRSHAVPCSGQLPYTGYEPRTCTSELGSLDLRDEVKSHHEVNGTCFETDPVRPGDGNHGNEDKKITSPPGIDEDHEGRLDSGDGGYASGDHNLEALAVEGHQTESAAAVAVTVDGSGEGQETSAPNIQVCEDLDVTADSGVQDVLDTSLLSVSGAAAPDGDENQSDGSYTTTSRSPGRSRTSSSSTLVGHPDSQSSGSSIEILDPLGSFITDQSDDTGYRLEGIGNLPLGTGQSNHHQHHENRQNVPHFANYLADEGDVDNFEPLEDEAFTVSPNSSDEEVNVLTTENDGGLSLTESWLAQHFVHNGGPTRRNVLVDTDDTSPRDVSYMYPPRDDYPLYDGHYNQLPRVELLQQTTDLFEKCGVARRDMRYWPSIELQREKVVEQMMEVHKEPRFWKHVPMFKYRREEGVDAGGITRDVFARFWKRGRDQFCKLVTLDCFDTKECPARCDCDFCSNIWAQSVVMGHQIPLYSPEGLVLATCCSANKVTPGHKSRCVQLFKKRWPDSVQRMLNESCMYGLSSQSRDDVVQIFERYRYQFTLPVESLENDPDLFKDQLEQMVINWLYGSSGPHFIQLCRAKLEEILGPLTPDHANQMWKSITPTGKGILDLLDCTDPRPHVGTPEYRALEYLKKFIRDKSGEVEVLCKLLQVITGSPSLTAPYIIVHFRPDGLPQVSTCGYSITLPTNVGSYDDFKFKMTELLASGESDRFTIM